MIHSATEEFQVSRNLKISLTQVSQSSARRNAKVCTWSRVNTSQGVNCLNSSLVEKDLGSLRKASKTKSHQGALITSTGNCIMDYLKNVARGRSEVTSQFSSDVEAKE